MSVGCCRWSVRAVAGVLAGAVCAASAAQGQPIGAAPAGAVEGGAVNTLTEQERAAGFVLLFDGETLGGWTTSGNIAAWGVENGELAVLPGAEGGGGWWLRTVKQYRDFELLLDFNVPPRGNSGVGVRGSGGGDPAFTGFEVQVLDSAGEAPSVTNCGAVYDAVAPASMAVKPADEWNTYRIFLVGDTLNVWLNGEAIHTDQKLDERGFLHKPDQPSPLRDRLTTGHIALQDHGDPVRYRNIKIRDLSPDPDPGDFEPLLNGTDTAGWTARGAAAWTIEDGALVGRDGPGHLFSDRTFTDLEMRAHVRVNERGNSGFYFRTVPRPGAEDSWPLGYEAQVDHHDPKNFTGCVYDKAWPEHVKSPISRDGAWFDYRVRAVGDHVQTWINGLAMVDARLAEFKEGHIALQSHHKGNEVRWKDIAVRDPTKTEKQGAIADEPPGEHGKPVRVFYCTHSAGFRHQVLPETRTILNRLGSDLDWMEVIVSDDIRDLTPKRLAETDVVMLFTTGALPMGEMRARLIEWVHGGGGLVGVHSATDTFAEEADYVRTIGGTFDGHPWNEDVSIVVDDPAHPTMRAFVENPADMVDMADTSARFRIADEIYQFKSLDSGMRVLMRLDPGTAGAEAGRDYPLAWTREPGDGRVFYTALGHRPEVWRDARFIGHLTEGIRWAAGRESGVER